MDGLLVINLVLLITLVIGIVFLIFIVIGHGQVMLRDKNRREHERRRLEVEEALLVSLLVKADNIVGNLTNWYEIQTGQKWVFPNSDAVQKRLNALDQMIKNEEIKIQLEIDKEL